MGESTSLSVPVLEVRGLSKRYPGVQALRDVTWRVGAGEIHALLGPNGAGKSTLVSIVAGMERPDRGQVFIAGQELRRFEPLTAARLGVAIVPQKPDLFPSLCVLDNLFVGAWPRKAGLLDWRTMARRAEEVLAELGASIEPQACVGDLPVADRQMVQIARALLHDARLFIFDEPTAALSAEDTARLFALIRGLRDAGHGIVYITHRLPELAGFADRVTVMRDGAIVASLDSAEATEERLLGLMSGEAPPRRRDRRVAHGEPLLEVCGLSVEGVFVDCSFTVRRGEIVGVTGLAGSGAAELVRAVGGAAVARGRIILAGQAVPLGSVVAAQRAGVCLVPGDRHREGLFFGLSVRENITVAALRQLALAGGLVARRKEEALARRMVADLAIKARSLDQGVDTLSGGNQQKVLVGRALGAKPRLLALIEPTQGVDVASRAEIHGLLRDLAAQGVGVLIAGSDVPELLVVCDRLLVMHRGRLVADLEATTADEESVLRYSTGLGETGQEPDARWQGDEGGSFAPQKVLPRYPGRRRATLSREAVLAAFLAALALLVGVVNPQFLSASNLTDVTSNAAYVLVAAAAMTALIITGNIDISIGSMLGLCAALSGGLAVKGWPLWAVLAVAVAAGAALGAVNALGVVGLRLPSIIVTLGTLNVFRGLLILLTGGRWITGLPSEFRALSLARPFGIPASVLIAAAVATALAFALRFTRWGRCVYLWGDNPRAAMHLGVAGGRLVFGVMMLTGACVALAATMFAARFSAVQSNAGLGFEMVVITCVVVGGTNIFGGRGGILGTVLGVVLVALIGNALTLLHLSEYWEKAAQGGLILAAVTSDVFRRRRREQ